MNFCFLFRRRLPTGRTPRMASPFPCWTPSSRSSFSLPRIHPGKRSDTFFSPSLTAKRTLLAENIDEIGRQVRCAFFWGCSGSDCWVVLPLFQELPGLHRARNSHVRMERPLHGSFLYSWARRAQSPPTQPSLSPAAASAGQKSDRRCVRSHREQPRLRESANSQGPKTNLCSSVQQKAGFQTVLFLSLFFHSIFVSWKILRMSAAGLDIRPPPNECLFFFSQWSELETYMAAS